jgi:hypothetical protein
LLRLLVSAGDRSPNRARRRAPQARGGAVVRLKTKIPDTGTCAASRCAEPSTVIIAVDAKPFGLCDRHLVERGEDQDREREKQITAAASASP